MKKYYESPVTILVAIEIQQMIASSTLNASDGTPSVEVSSEQFGGTFSARGGGSWDDED